MDDRSLLHANVFMALGGGLEAHTTFLRHHGHGEQCSVQRSQGLRKHLYAALPLDLRPSKTAVRLLTSTQSLVFQSPVILPGTGLRNRHFRDRIVIGFHLFILPFSNGRSA